jgi:hypothetical protein
MHQVGIILADAAKAGAHLEVVVECWVIGGGDEHAVAIIADAVKQVVQNGAAACTGAGGAFVQCS